MRYLESQKYSECQLVAVLNACTYLTGGSFDQETKEYERLVDLVKARNGAAIGIGKAIAKLDMESQEGKRDLRWIRKNLPVGIDIWHIRYGIHAVCIVGVRGDLVRVTNLGRVFRRKWIPWRKFKRIVRQLRGHPPCVSFTMKEA